MAEIDFILNKEIAFEVKQKALPADQKRLIRLASDLELQKSCRNKQYHHRNATDRLPLVLVTTIVYVTIVPLLNILFIRILSAKKEIHPTPSFSRHCYNLSVRLFLMTRQTDQ